MRFSILFFIPLFYSQPFYPSIKKPSEQNPYPKSLILYKPYLRSNLYAIPLHSKEEVEVKEEEYIEYIELL